MKNFGVFLVCLLLLSCESDSSLNRNNPFLTDPLVSLQLDLSLPQYNPLNFPGNSVVINAQGIKGIVVYNLDNNQYVAFDLTDPNHIPNECSRMTIQGVEASCPCPDEHNKYNIITGQHFTNPNLYPMQRYRAVKNGNAISITN